MTLSVLFLLCDLISFQNKSLLIFMLAIFVKKKLHGMERILRNPPEKEKKPFCVCEFL